MIAQVLRHDGGLDIGGVFKFRNEHPIAIPKLLYWINARVANGSNVTLGMVVIMIVTITVVAVAVIARKTPSMDRWSRIGVVVAASFLLFSFNGSWYFVKAMSGTAWLTSFFFVVAAFAAHATGRRFLPIIFGLLACLSYGTGLGVWPALLVAAALRDRSIVRQWPVAITSTAVLGWYWVRYQEVRTPRSVWFPEPTLSERVEGALTTAGSFVRFQAGGATVRIGAVLLGIGLIAALAVIWSIWSSPPSANKAGATAWVGLFGFSVVQMFLLSGSRAVWGIEQSGGRYSIVGATMCLATLGLVLTALPLMPAISRGAAHVAAVMAFIVVVAIGLGGQHNAESLRRTRAGQDRFQVAMHLNLASGQRAWQGGLEEVPVGIEDLLRDTGHHPFSARNELGCGLIGRIVDEDQLAPGSPISGKFYRGTPSSPVQGGEFIDGYLDVGEAEIDCIIAVGNTGRVRGSGGFGSPSDGYLASFVDQDVEGRVAFNLVALQSEEIEVWYRLKGETTFHRLPG